MKIIVTSDIHLANDQTVGGTNPQTGLTHRFEDYLRNLDTICTYATENADLLIIAGDVYHSRKPSETVRREFAKRLKETLKVIPVLIVIGNHDLYYQAGLAHTLSVLQVLQLNNLYIVDKPTMLSIGDCYFVCVPFLSAAKEKIRPSALSEKWNEDVRGILPSDNFQKSILIAHQTFEGGVGGDERISLSRYDDHSITPAADIVDRIDIAFVGHLHRAQEYIVNSLKVVYPGSIENIDMGEATYKKRFLEYDTSSNKMSECTLSHRKYYNIKANIEEKTEDEIVTMIEEIPDLDEAVVKVTIEVADKDSKWIDKRKIKEALKKAWWAYDIVEQKRSEVEESNELEVSEKLEIGSAVNLYIDRKIEDFKRRELLKRVADNIIKEETENDVEY